MRRSNDGTTTKLTVYAFGLEEHQYEEGGSLSNTGNTFYYVVGGGIVGMLTGTTTLSTTFLLTDTLGSVISNFRNIAGSAQVLGNQLYDPYGNQRYKQGELGTDKGYTGQYSDSLTGLDYYVSRYYDPLIGRFISADTVQGNLQGEDPYAYVGGNPQTMNDPTGHWKKRATDGVGGNGVAIQPGGPAAGDKLLDWIWYTLLGGTTIAVAESIRTSGGGTTTGDTPTPAPAASVKTSVEKLISYTGQNEWTQHEQKADIVGNGGSGLSLEVAKYRESKIRAYQKNPAGPNPKGSNGAGAVLSIWDSNNGDKAVVLPLYALGFSRQNNKDYPHAEELLVGLADGVIRGRKLQLPNGYIVRVMMLIYSQAPVCPECNGKLDKWLQQLYDAAGGRAKVDLHVWHLMPPGFHSSRRKG